MQWISTVLVFLAGLFAAPAVAGQAQPSGAAKTVSVSTADGNGINLKSSPALTGERRPLYRLRKSDVVEVRFTFSPEFDQTAAIQPDGIVSLRNVEGIFAEGLTVDDLRELVRVSYSAFLRDPKVSVILKDFEKPFFIAGGQFTRPGKYELRSSTTVSEAVAIAGGFNDQAKHSQVVLFRRLLDGVVEAHILNVKSMLDSRNLEEDIELKPGDMVFVPQNRISKIRKFLPASSLSTYFAPTQY